MFRRGRCVGHCLAGERDTIGKQTEGNVAGIMVQTRSVMITDGERERVFGLRCDRAKEAAGVIVS